MFKVTTLDIVYNRETDSYNQVYETRIMDMAQLSADFSHRVLNSVLSEGYWTKCDTFKLSVQDDFTLFSQTIITRE